MRLALVGMSGAGKTYWSQRLAENGYLHVCCDDLIAARVGFDSSDSEESIAALSAWMGFPWDEGYRDRAQQYRQHETDVLESALAWVPGDGTERVVLDTTGSMVYLESELLGRMRDLFVVVHLETPLEVQGEMAESFISRPTPLIWPEEYGSDLFADELDSLRGLFPRLLQERERLYSDLSHVGVPLATRGSPEFGPVHILEMAGASGAS